MLKHSLFTIILGCIREIGAKWALRHHFVTTHVQPSLPLKCIMLVISFSHIPKRFLEGGSVEGRHTAAMGSMSTDSNTNCKPIMTSSRLHHSHSKIPLQSLTQQSPAQLGAMAPQLL